MPRQGGDAFVTPAQLSETGSHFVPRDNPESYESDAVTKTRSGRGKAKPGIDKTRRVLRLALDWAAAVRLITESPVPESARPKRGKKNAEAA